MSRADKIILKVENVSKLFPMENKGVLTAVDHVSFRIYEGECFAVIGESGCGKSTLAKLIIQVEPATSGNIYFNDQDVTHIRGRNLKAMHRDMQMVFQNALSVVSPKMKIRDFLLEPYINFHIMFRKDALVNIKKMLEQVRLTDAVLDKYPHQLSGGELQRVCIARAFGMNPKMMICDEITSALDVSVQDDVMKLFRKMQKEHGIACLFICHDLALVNNYSDMVMVMYLGQAVEILPSDKLGAKAMHPYTQGLLQSVMFVSTDRDEPVKTLQGEPQSPVNVQQNCRFCNRCPYATEECFKKAPPLREVEPRHLVACFKVIV